MDENRLKKFLGDFQKAIDKRLEIFQKSINEQLEVILKRQKTFQESLDIIDRDMSNDRANIDDIKLRQGNIDAQFVEFRHMMGEQTKKIQESAKDAMADAVEPVLNQVQELTNIMTTDE